MTKRLATIHRLPADRRTDRRTDDNRAIAVARQKCA